MSNDEYGFSDDDLKNAGGSGKPLEIGKYTFRIEEAETKTSSSGKLYLKLKLQIPEDLPNGKRVVFENYLPLGKNNEGKLTRKTANFFRAIGLKAGDLPPGTPNGPSVDVLQGILIQNQIDHEYETGETNPQGYPVRVKHWTPEGKAIAEKAGGADKVKGEIQAVPGSNYEMADAFEGLDAAGGAADEQWG